MMTDTRDLAHQLIDCLPETQLPGLVRFLEAIFDPVAVALRNAPLDDEPETDDEKRRRHRSEVLAPEQRRQRHSSLRSHAKARLGVVEVEWTVTALADIPSFVSASVTTRVRFHQDNDILRILRVRNRREAYR